MATIKFQTVSPYEGIQDRQHHGSDWKYDKFLQSMADHKSSAKGETSSVVSLALFGLGRAGTIHLNNILGLRTVSLKYIIENDEARCQDIKRRLNLSEVTFLKFDQADRVFNDKTLRAVMVATPTASHEEIITRSLKAGKAVFTEKPVSEEPDAVGRCYELAAQVGQPLFCAFNRRFDPSYRDVKERVHAGQLGQVQQIKLTSRDSPLPTAAYLRISGGIFHDCMVHDIDLMTHILGELPIEVFTAANAFIPEIREMNDFDTVVSTYKFASGTVGVVDISRFASYGYDQRLEVFGPGGMLQVDNERPTSSTHFTNTGVSRAPIYWSFPSRYYQGYINELNHFVDVVNGRVKSSVSYQMTCAVSKIAEAAEASARQGKPVKINWRPEEIPEGYVMM